MLIFTLWTSFRESLGTMLPWLWWWAAVTRFPDCPSWIVLKLWCHSCYSVWRCWNVFYHCFEKHWFWMMMKIDTISAACLVWTQNVITFIYCKSYSTTKILWLLIEVISLSIFISLTHRDSHSSWKESIRVYQSSGHDRKYQCHVWKRSRSIIISHKTSCWS